MTWQYYYRDGECTANGYDDPSCICWHEEGTGPRSGASPEDQTLKWRDYPRDELSKLRLEILNLKAQLTDVEKWKEEGERLFNLEMRASVLFSIASWWADRPR